MKKLLAACCLIIACPLAKADYLDLQVERTARNIAALHNWRGIVEQRGLYGSEPVVTRTVFARPHDFHSEVTAPAELAGTVLHYTPGRLLAWYPRQETALVLDGFAPPSSATEGKRVDTIYRANVAAYFYALGEVTELDGRPVIAVDQRARRPAQLVQSSHTRVFDNYSFPLAGKLVLRGGARLDYRYRDVVFNEEGLAVPPAPVLPPQAMVVRWDLAWPPVDDARAEQRLPRAPRLPATLGGLPRARLLEHPESVPAVAGWYSNGDFYLFVAASRDTGFRLLSADYGLSVPLGEDTAQVAISPLGSQWTWLQDGVLLSVLTNLHPEVAYGALQSLAMPATPPEKPHEGAQR